MSFVAEIKEKEIKVEKIQIVIFIQNTKHSKSLKEYGRRNYQS